MQNRYAPGASPQTEQMLDLCGAEGIAFVPFFAIAGPGGGGGATGREADEVLAAARAHDVSPARVRLAFTLQRGPHVLAIPGTGDPDHLADNVAAAGLTLTPGEMARLKEARQPA